MQTNIEDESFVKDVLLTMRKAEALGHFSVRWSYRRPSAAIGALRKGLPLGKEDGEWIKCSKDILSYLFSVSYECRLYGSDFDGGSFFGQGEEVEGALKKKGYFSIDMRSGLEEKAECFWLGIDDGRPPRATGDIYFISKFHNPFEDTLLAHTKNPSVIENLGPKSSSRAGFKFASKMVAEDENIMIFLFWPNHIHIFASPSNIGRIFKSAMGVCRLDNENGTVFETASDRKALISMIPN